MTKATVPRPDRYMSESMLGKVYRAILIIQNDSGLIPSQIEIAAETGLSQGSVSFALRELAYRGYISKEPCKSRSIQVLKPFPRNGAKA